MAEAARAVDRPEGVGKQIRDRQPLFVVSCSFGFVLDAVQSRPRHGHKIRSVSQGVLLSLPLVCNSLAKRFSHLMGFDLSVCPHVYDAC